MTQLRQEFVVVVRLDACGIDLYRWAEASFHLVKDRDVMGDARFQPLFVEPIPGQRGLPPGRARPAVQLLDFLDALLNLFRRRLGRLDVI